MFDAWSPRVLDARSDEDRAWVSGCLKHVRTEPHGQDKELAPCPDACLVRVTVRRVSLEAQPDESDSETLKTLVAGLRAFAERELVAPQEPPPGATVYTFKLKDQS